MSPSPPESGSPHWASSLETLATTIWWFTRLASVVLWWSSRVR
jgi:hypothetical protein